MRFHISFNWKTIKKCLIPLGLALALFLGFNTMKVNALTITPDSWSLNVNGTELSSSRFGTWGAGYLYYNLTAQTRIDMTELSSFQKTFYFRYTVCSDSDTSGGWSNTSWVSNVWFERTNMSCSYAGSSYTGGRVQYITFQGQPPIQAVDPATTSDLSVNWSNTVASNYYSNSSLQLIAFEISDTPFSIDPVDQTIINQNQQQIEEQEKTNEKLDDLKEQEKETYDYISDDTPPESDISSLGNVQGLLPPGPVDSLLNIPFQFLSVINSSFGGVCVPYTGDFVFDSTLTLPCFSEMFYDEVPPLLLNFLSLIPASFILMQYFKHLYKKVNRAVSMETTADDEWGVL